MVILGKSTIQSMLVLPFAQILTAHHAALFTHLKAAPRHFLASNGKQMLLMGKLTKVDLSKGGRAYVFKTKGQLFTIDAVSLLAITWVNINEQLTLIKLGLALFAVITYAIVAGIDPSIDLTQPQHGLFLQHIAPIRCATTRAGTMLIVGGG